MCATQLSCQMSGTHFRCNLGRPHHGFMDKDSGLPPDLAPLPGALKASTLRLGSASPLLKQELLWRKNLPPPTIPNISSQDSHFVGIMQPALTAHQSPSTPACTPSQGKRSILPDCELGDIVAHLFLFSFSLDSSCVRENECCSSTQHPDEQPPRGRRVCPAIRQVRISEPTCQQL